MPRGKRVLIQNSYYHVVNRGNQKQNIFFDSLGYQEYLKILKHYKKKYFVKVLGYCLMPNHIHLILNLKTPNELAKFMQCLTQTYTGWFNKKYSKVGRLWQGRFKSMNIDNDDYFLECVYYVEKNPVRSGLTSSPADYLWSSYNERVLGIKKGLLDFPDST